MALTIIPSYFASSTARVIHAGDISVSGTCVIPDSTTTVPSAGDIVYLCKIPDQAVIIDFEEDHTAADTVGLDFGLHKGTDTNDATYSSLISAGAKSTLNRRSVLNNTGGVKCSISDSDPNGFGILAAKVASGSLTATITINWKVVYRMDADPLSV